jgi:hypothetical protein
MAAPGIRFGSGATATAADVAADQTDYSEVGRARPGLAYQICGAPFRARATTSM